MKAQAVALSKQPRCAIATGVYRIVSLDFQLINRSLGFISIYGLFYYLPYPTLILYFLFEGLLQLSSTNSGVTARLAV